MTLGRSEAARFLYRVVGWQQLAVKTPKEPPDGHGRTDAKCFVENPAEPIGAADFSIVGHHAVTNLDNEPGVDQLVAFAARDSLDDQGARERNIRIRRREQREWRRASASPA